MMHQTFIALMFLCLIGSVIPLQQESTTSKVKVTLYYESLCPACQDFIIQQIYPTLAASGVRDIVDLRLVPYGNAREQQISGM
jgi:interferon gamma-inducible protein 30